MFIGPVDAPYTRLGDRRAGKCISVFTNNRIPYCVKFNPDPDKQNFFLAGCSDKKIIQVRGARARRAASPGRRVC